MNLGVGSIIRPLPLWHNSTRGSRGVSATRWPTTKGSLRVMTAARPCKKNGSRVAIGTLRAEPLSVRCETLHPTRPTVFPLDHPARSFVV